jgi:hypothetical protein
VTAYRCALVRKPRATRRHRHPKQPRPVYRQCRSPKSYTHLKAARYTFYVKAVGPGGTSATAATRSFTITSPS